MWISVLKIPRPPPSTLFPYTTLFRSVPAGAVDEVQVRRCLDVSHARLHESPRQQAALAELVAVAIAERVGLALQIEDVRSEEHTSELQSQSNLVCRLLLE